MKNKIIFPLAFAALLISAAANAQTVSMSFDGQELTLSKDSKAQLVLFTGRYFEGKNYLHWDVKNQSSDGIYIIYRSLDGTNFEVLGHKKGIGVPIPTPIAYYFQDENPCCEITYYKLIHLAKDNNTYLASEKIAVQGHALLLSQIK